MKRIVLFDMDGPLADFEQGFLDIWRSRHPELPFVPLDQRQSFYIADQYPPKYKAEIYEIVGAPGFIRNLKPVEGALGALRYVNSYLPYVELMICTSPLSDYNPCVLEKFQWVEDHLGHDFTKKIILTKDKTIIRADYLIDDKPNITGIMTPTWEHLVFDAAYNAKSPGRHINWTNWEWFLKELNS